MLGNNVLAQVPDINDFAAGVKMLLADDGTVTFEFPHLATLIEGSSTTRSTTSTSRTSRSTRYGCIFGALGLTSSTSTGSRLTAARCGSTSATMRRKAEPSAAVARILEIGGGPARP